MKQRFLPFFGSILAGTIMLLNCGSCTQNTDKPFFFIQMADTQFGKFESDASFKKETVLFTKAIDEANRLNPAFVVITGDLINKPGDPAQIAEFKRIAAQLNKSIPLYLVSGNQDVEKVPTNSSLQEYARQFGPDRYIFAYQNSRFIVLNSTIIHRSDSVPEAEIEQFNWLEKELKSKPAGTGQTFVLLHHPFFLEEADEISSYFNIPEAKRAWYLNMFHEFGVKAIFAGHYHRNAHGYFKEMEMITTGPVGMPFGEDKSGFRIVKVHANRIEHQYYEFEKMPVSVSFEE